MLAHQFMTYVNANSNSIEVKVFPASQLGQTREVIEAMRLGSGASGTTCRPAEYASFVKLVGVLGLPFMWKSYDNAQAVLDANAMHVFPGGWSYTFKAVFALRCSADAADSRHGKLAADHGSGIEVVAPRTFAQSIKVDLSADVASESEASSDVEQRLEEQFEGQIEFVRQADGIHDEVSWLWDRTHTGDEAKISWGTTQDVLSLGSQTILPEG